MGTMVKDPVCGMEVDADKAAATSTHMGKSFSFCSDECKETFDKKPMQYMMTEKKEKSGGCC